jgi:hypothetical protein
MSVVGDGNRCHLLVLDLGTIVTATRDTDDQWSGEEMISAIAASQQVVAPPTGLNDIPRSVIVSGGFNGIAGATVSGGLHLAAHASVSITYPPVSTPPSTIELPLWHAVERDDGTWTEWESVNVGPVTVNQDGPGDPLVPAYGHFDDALDFAVVAGIDTTLHIVISKQRNTFHATLDATGALSPWDNLGSLPGTATAIDMTAVDSNCHVIIARDDGGLWHTIIGSNGSLPWGDVWTQLPRLPSRIVSLATAGFPFVHAASHAAPLATTHSASQRPRHPVPVSDAPSHM